jgi:6-phosphofructokinase 1
MGGNCGYLALLAGLSGGAVRVYLHEEGITLKDLSVDVERMVDSFRAGQRLFMVVANEKASPMYTSDFLCRLFEQESQDLFDARKVVLGQTQQGGTPSPFDRILGTRLAAHAMDWISNEIDRSRADNAVIGTINGSVKVMSMRQAEDLADWENRRPLKQWWMDLRPILDVLAQRLPVEQTRTF